MQYVQLSDSETQPTVIPYKKSIKNDIHTNAVINTRKTFITKDIQSYIWNAQEKNDGLISFQTFYDMPMRHNI